MLSFLSLGSPRTGGAHASRNQAPELIATLSGAAVSWPLGARAQQPAMPVIGVLHHASPDVASGLVAAFQHGLKETGFIENQNVQIEYRWARYQYDRLPQLAADLVRRQVAAILANTPTMQVAKAATATIPIVFVSADDPVPPGVVASFNRPGGNATGIYFVISALEAKRAELLHELVPKASAMALLLDPNFPSAETQSRDMQAAVHSLGLNLVVLKAGTTDEINTVFATLVRERIGVMAVAASGFFFFQVKQLIALAARNGVPVVSLSRSPCWGAPTRSSSEAPRLHHAGRKCGSVAARGACATAANAGDRVPQHLLVV